MLKRFASLLSIVLIGSLLTAATPAQAYSTAQAVIYGNSYTEVYSQAGGDTFAATIQLGTQLSIAISRGGTRLKEFTFQTPNGEFAPGVYRNADAHWETRQLWQPQIQIDAQTPCNGGSFTIFRFARSGMVITELDMAYDQPTCYWYQVDSVGRITIDNPGATLPAAGPRVLIADNDPVRPGHLRLLAEAPAQFKSLSAKLYAPGTSALAATVTSFVKGGENETRNEWRSTSQVNLSEPGYYRVDTEITDLNNVTSTQTGVGYFDARSTVQVSAALDASTLTYSSKTTSVRGSVKRTLPSGGPAVAFGGVTVEVYLPSAHSSSAWSNREHVLLGSTLTNPDGSYALTIAPLRTDVVYVVYRGDLAGHVLSAESAPLPFRIESATTRVTTQGVFWLPSMTIIGKAFFEADGRQIPHSGAQLTVQYHNAQGNFGDPAEGTTTVNSDGTFSVPVSLSFTPTEGYLSLDITPSDPFVGPSFAQMQFGTYQAGAAFDGFIGYWDGNFPHFIGALTFSGAQPAKVPFQLQRRMDDGSWLTQTVVYGILYEGTWYLDTLWFAPCGTSYWRLSYGDGLPGVTPAISNTLWAGRSCSRAMESAQGTGGPGTPRLPS